jgi:hypothetical protein
MVLQIKEFAPETKDHFLDARKSKNVHLTSLVDRLMFDIKIDITKIANPWVITDYNNVTGNGIFRINKLFYQKGVSGTYRRVFAYNLYGTYLVWPEQENKKVLSFRKYLNDSTDYAAE